MKDDVILLNLKEDVEFKNKDVTKLSGFTICQCKLKEKNRSCE